MQLNCIFHRERENNEQFFRDFHAGTRHVSYINHKHQQQVDDDDDGDGGVVQLPAPASSSLLFPGFSQFSPAEEEVGKIILRQRNSKR